MIQYEVKREAGLIISKDFPYYDFIHKDLLRTITTWNDSVEDLAFYKMDSETGDLIIPRFYNFSEDLPKNDLNIKIIDNRVEGEKIKIKSKITPMNDRQAEYMKYFDDHDSGVIQLETGCGKTVIAIHGICQIKQKTIIFTNKKSLVTQWKERFLEFTNLKDDDIAILQTSSFEKDFDKPIIISTIQMFLSGLENDKFVECLKNSKLGVTIFDECHTTVGPEKFSECSLNMSTKFVYGLSATPNSRYNCNDIIFKHLGGIFYIPPDENDLIKPKIYVYKFPFGVYERFSRYISWGGKFSMSRYFTQMKKVDTYLDVMVKLIKKVYESDRITLVLGTRIETMLEIIKRCGFPKEDVGIYIPTCKKVDIMKYSDTSDLYKAFYDKRIVFSTYNASKEGNDRKDFDCLIMSTCTANVVQPVGRILRKCENKKNPLVFDFVDIQGPLVKCKKTQSKLPYFVRSYVYRKEKYEDMDWEVIEKDITQKV